jgi:sugar lactone lactonase YvrE
LPASSNAEEDILLAQTKTRTQQLRLALLCAPAFAACCLLPCSATAQTAAPPPLQPTGIAYDAAGNLYVADTARHQVFEATVGGKWLLVAGSGVQGFSGDGGAATAAELNAPQAIAVGPDGTLYIADTGNQRIRAITNGIITTFAGNGSASFSGDGGPAISASLAQPTALALDPSGALLLCDSGNQRIRRIAGGTITTIAGNGIQGFSGDGGPAPTAELDTPSAIAVSSDGRIFISDAHNNRIRVIATNGTITTFAAQLALPRGIAVTPSGAAIVADTNNQRLRSIDTSGNTTTLAGSGVQGNAPDGSLALNAALDIPTSIAISSFGNPTFADTANHTIRILASDGKLYLPAALASSRSSGINISVPATAVYGSTNATVTVTGSIGTPQGVVQLFDSSTSIAQSHLSAGLAALSLASLSAGAHVVHATYSGDGLNPAATSSASSLTITPAALLATANPQTVLYGAAIPSLTGSLSGVLAQDADSVTALFNTTAKILSPVGTYPITASLSGPASANYSVALSPSSGSLQIVAAPTTTLAQNPSQNSFAGLPLLLSASVVSSTSGTPTGAVNFVEGTTTVASATLNHGAVSAAYLSPAAGTHSLVASYTGDTNFTPSISPAITAVVLAMPDFSLAGSGSATQTVQPGSIATYSFAIAAQPAPFTGAVSMGVSGLPTGATASFSPPQVIPGSATATTVLSVQTLATVVQASPTFPHSILCALLLPLLILRRRRIALASALCLLFFALGCGSRSVPEQTQPSHAYTLTITGTSTNLAGALVVHSTTVTLNIQ